MNQVALLFYRLFILPFLGFLAVLLSPISNKLREGLRMRRKQRGLWPWLFPKQGQRPIWFHCASGEFEYAKPVIRELKLQHPDIPIMVTYYTPSYRGIIEKYPLVDIALPLPFDLPSIWHSFLLHHQPRALLIARTDLWPEMLIQTRKVGLPILLFATTLGLSNRRMRWWARPWINLILNPITQISCVSEEDRANFAKLGLIEKIKVDGDTRYDEVIHRQEKQNPLPDIFLSPMNEPIFLAGSTWSEDEAVLMPLIQQSLKANNNVRFILCPHEPSLHHLQQLRGRLDAHRINWQFLSQVSTPWHKDTVIIVDQVGILADLYKLADIAFIGGSFARRVHSVMEALASGCWTWFGPRHKTNREAIEFTNLQFENRFPLALTIHSTKEAQQAMDRWLGFDAKEKFREELKKQVLLRSGASKRIARWLEPYVGTKI